MPKPLLTKSYTSWRIAWSIGDSSTTTSEQTKFCQPECNKEDSQQHSKWVATGRVPGLNREYVEGHASVVIGSKALCDGDPTGSGHSAWYIST